MGKEKPGFLTPKAIANRIKSKGLQKLRWYCQMCQKQCRDENGFKCHTTSESHQRQLLLFADNSSKFMDGFSSEFNTCYVNTLKRRFGTKRVHANIVYQEYINDKDHIHMNSTRWLTLTDYVKWLGRKGICIVDETEKGWFVTYIDRDPETLRRQEEIERKKKLDLDDRERQQIFLDKQMERNKDDIKQTEATDLIKSENETIKINFLKKKTLIKSDESKEESLKAVKEENGQDKPISNFDSKEESEKKPKLYPMAPPATTAKPSTSSSNEKRKLSALDEIITMEEKKREKQNRKDYWLHKNIVVKIATNKLGEKYYKKKAVVLDVDDKYTANIKLLDSGSVIKIDQAHLETVLPAIGKQVLILNGAYRGETATLEAINEKDFNAKLMISSGTLNGRIVNGVQYEDISKIHQD